MNLGEKFHHILEKTWISSCENFPEIEKIFKNV